MTTATEPRYLMSTAKRTNKARSVTLEWEIGTLPAKDGYGERKLVAELDIHHKKAGPNYFTGDTTTEDHFDVTLTNVTTEELFNKEGERIGESRAFTLFSGLGIARLPAGNRFSQKKLREAVDTGYAAFREAYESGDERVLSYFDFEKARERR